jgi:hypothetical protein
LNDPWERIHPGLDTYEFLDYIGRFPVQPLPIQARYEPMDGKYISFIEPNVLARLQGLSGDYVYSRSDYKHNDASVRKMDRAPCYDFEKCPNFYLAFAYVSDMFRECLKVRHMTPQEVLETSELDKAAGFFFSQKGFKKKADVVRAGYMSRMFDPQLTSFRPLWKAVGKEEYRLREHYLLQDKQRTFIVEPFELYFHHKRIFGNQNEAIKGVGWSAYGLNPYEGGVNRMAKRLLRNPRFIMLDGKLWDRVFAIMSYIYKMRAEGVDFDSFMEWVIANNICSFVLLPNGDVIFKTWGNNSGSATTTGDNILGMALCVAHSFLNLGLLPQQLDHIVAYLFGDDVMLSHNLPLSVSDEQIEKVFRDTFLMYGVEMDPFVSGSNLSDFTFLGFTFEKMDDHWVPKYPLDRLAFSFLHQHDKCSPEAEISKMSSLMLMSAGNGEEYFSLFRTAFMDVILNVDVAITKQLRLNNFAAVPSFADVVNWYCGLEGSCVVSNFLHTVTVLEGGDEAQNCYEQGRTSEQTFG